MTNILIRYYNKTKCTYTRRVLEICGLNVNVIYYIVIQTAVVEAYDTYPRERV